jgi:hypothetical protein
VTPDRQIAASSGMARAPCGTARLESHQQADYNLILQRVDANGIYRRSDHDANHPWAGGDEFDIIWSATHWFLRDRTDRDDRSR